MTHPLIYQAACPDCHDTHVDSDTGGLCSSCKGALPLPDPAPRRMAQAELYLLLHPTADVGAVARSYRLTKEQTAVLVKLEAGFDRTARPRARSAPQNQPAREDERCPERAAGVERSATPEPGRARMPLPTERTTS